jgi:hypothetical protein
VAVVAEAIACTGNLAQGLRKEYSGPARTLASVLLEKYKDKNTGVVKATTEALTNMHKHCWPLLDVAEDFTGAAGAHQHTATYGMLSCGCTCASSMPDQHTGGGLAASL